MEEEVEQSDEHQRTENVHSTEHQKPPRKCVILCTVALYASFMAHGLAISVVGPTIVSMEILLDTNIKSLSSAFAAINIGSLVGCIVSGFVYAPLNKELIFTTVLLGLAMSTGLAPYASHLYGYVAACGALGFFNGVIGAGGQPYILNLWEDRRFRQPVMQAAHLSWSVGSTVGPFIVQPFLVDISKDTNTTQEPQESVMVSADELTVAYNVVQDHFGNTSKEYDVNATHYVNTSELAKVRYGYVAVASLIAVCSVVFLATFFIIRPSCFAQVHHKNQRLNRKYKASRQSNKSFKNTMLTLACVILFSMAWTGNSMGSFLAAFGVKALGWSNSKSAFLPSAFMGALGVGRFVGIPLAICVSPRNMMILDITCEHVGLITLFFLHYWQPLVWVGTIFVGLGIGTMFATMFLWIENYLEITGAVSSLLVTMTSLGGIVAPPLAGYLFEDVDYMFIVYLPFAANCLTILFFIIANVYAHKNRTMLEIPGCEVDILPQQNGLQDRDALKSSEDKQETVLL